MQKIIIKCFHSGIAEESPKTIDLSRLYILFSQCGSCDDAQEDWSFVFLIEGSARRHEYACMRSFWWAKGRTEPPECWQMICIGKTKCTSEKGLFQPGWWPKHERRKSTCYVHWCSIGPDLIFHLSEFHSGFKSNQWANAEQPSDQLELLGIWMLIL